MKDKEKTEKILHNLIISTQHNNSIVIPEFRFGSGYGGVRERRIDLFEIYTTGDNKTVSYEIKVSRADFKKDLNNPEKQKGARLFSNEFYYVTPVGLIKPEELPVWAGLIEVDMEAPDYVLCGKHFGGDFYTYNLNMNTVNYAPALSREMPTWTLMVSAFRRKNSVLSYPNPFDKLLEDEKGNILQPYVNYKERVDESMGISLLILDEPPKMERNHEKMMELFGETIKKRKENN